MNVVFLTEHMALNFNEYMFLNGYTVKSHFKALGLYNFIRGFGWAYKRGGVISGWAYRWNKKKMFGNDEIKRI